MEKMKWAVWDGISKRLLTEPLSLAAARDYVKDAVRMNIENKRWLKVVPIAI